MRPGAIPGREDHDNYRPKTLRGALAQSLLLPEDLSASRRNTLRKWLILGLLFIAIAAAFYMVPRTTLLTLQVVFWFFFAMVIAWRFALLVAALVSRVEDSVDEVPLRDDLPVYSVLVAVRHEANMMAQLGRNLSALDWPADKLDVIILVEADDPGTVEAAHAAAFPAGTRILIVPPGTPMTKPRALNFGLAHAEGDFITIYDAEDRPDPQQLKAALQAFDAGGPGVVCVQAPLVATNGSHGWLPAHWALEYRVQFGIFVRALARLAYPVMLGGTSNHFRRRDLIAIGAWDAWNVTEDADLGIRIARMGGFTAGIDLPTYEAGPRRLNVWLAQRSRWIKGYMQTWLVAMRSPARLLRELGTMRWISVNLTLGGALLSSVLYGPMSVMVFLGLAFDLVPLDAISFGIFGMGWLVGFLTDVSAPGKWTFSRCLAIATRPLYWPLHTLAAVKAVYGLAVRPSFWAKTPHQPDEKERGAPWHSGSSPS
ncbi:MAG: glycosyltransferase [Henriciella sp.]|uniref:glycosyltransferase n=1 Tax=Henriciella sp. TaxID=1968823 RepID=UPI003C7832EE